MGGNGSGKFNPELRRAGSVNRAFTSTVHKMYGLFDKGELTFVEWTDKEARDAGLRLSQRDNEKPRPMESRYQVAEVFVVTSNLVSLYLSDARHVLEAATSEFRKLKKREEEMIDDAVRNKSRLDDNYWQPRYSAWLKMESARRIVEAIERGEVA